MRRMLAQTGAYRIVKNEAERGALSHAYLLLLPDERNLRDALKFFGELLLDADERKCSLIEKEIFSDCKIYPEMGKRLSTDNANAVLADCRIQPVEGEKKLFILDKFHDANPSVQNKLLKVLEEPPQGVIFLLGAVNEFSLLPTVKSRVRKLEIPPFSLEEVTRFLQRNYPDREDVANIAAASGGVVGKAQDLLEGTYYTQLLSLAIEFVGAKEQNIPAISSKIASIKQKQEFLSVLGLVFRDVLMYNLNRTPLLKGCREQIEPIAQDYTATSAIAALDVVATAEKDVKFNANFSMLVETMLIAINKEKNKCKKS